MRINAFFIIFVLIFYYDISAQQIILTPKNLKPFVYGVASGDATDTSVVIWTKINHENGEKKYRVLWQVATDSTFETLLDSGMVTALKENDYSVRVFVNNLNANTVYFYRFRVFGKYSMTGKTKTLPSKTQKIARFSAVFFTGSNYNAGYFNAYKSVNKRSDIDAVFHLGDYFYEYGNNQYPKKNIRKVEPDNECLTLDDYRKRLATYRSDSDLMKCHKNYCWYLMWDDHEIANNDWKNGALNHQKDEGEWDEREKAALKAYFEWMPVSFDNKDEAYRSYNVGNLATVILLETRLTGRDRQSISNDTNKSLLGDNQRRWLYNTILHAKKDSMHWIILLSQVMFAPLHFAGKVLNNDQWDGYSYERQKFLEFIDKNEITNLVIVSGDIHSSWVNIITTPGGIVIPEFITPSITSPSVGRFAGKFSNVVIKTFWRDIKYVNLWRRGYMQLVVTPDTIAAKWYYLKTIKVPDERIEKIVVRKYQRGKLLK